MELYNRKYKDVSSSSSSSSASDEEDQSDQEVEEDDDDEVKESPLKKQKTVRRLKDPLMNDQQREKLKGIPIDLQEFEKYLKKEDINIQTIGRVIGKVKILMSGTGITYKDWPNGVTFHAKPIRDLGTDFYKLQLDSIAYEEKYGRDCSKGWLVRHPLQKLEKVRRIILLHFTTNQHSL